MNIYIKFLLTIPSFIQLVYFLTYIFPQNFKWVIQIESEYFIPQIINLSVFITSLFLIKRLWNYKNIIRDTKWLWTFALIIFGAIANPIYLWKMDDKFNIENSQ